MTLTTEQIERILEDAPEGATHYESEYKYLKAARSGYMVFDTEGGDWDYEYVGICETHNLSDLRRILKQEATILALRQRVQELEAHVEQLHAALKHLHHNAKVSGAEMGLALDVAEEALELSPQQNLNAIKRDAFIYGFMESGEGFNGELYQDGWSEVVKGFDEIVNTEYPSDKEGE